MGRRRRDGRLDRGFTLIEVLIVVVILGVLSAVVALAVLGITDRGDSAAAAADRSTLVSAQEAYFAKYGRYASEDELDGGFIRGQSSTHDVCLSGDRKRFVVVAAGEECPGDLGA